MKLKVITLNVWIGGILFDEIERFLREEDPDILFLQEVFDGKESSLTPQHKTFSELKKRLNFAHGHFAPAFTEEIEGFAVSEVIQGNAILSKYPLEAVSVVFYDVPFGNRINKLSDFHRSPRNLQHVVAQVGDTSLHLLNTQGIWGEDGNDTPRRIAMSKMILKEVGDNSPLILAGDMNVEPHTQSIAQIEARLTNVFKGDLATSFNITRKDLVKSPGYAKAVVDMMFVSSDIVVTRKSAPLIDLSDHLPLVAELEVE